MLPTIHQRTQADDNYVCVLLPEFLLIAAAVLSLIG